MSTSAVPTGWPLASRILGATVTFCLCDRLGNGKPFTGDSYARFQTLEELGIESWRSQLLQALLSSQPPIALSTSATTWRLAGLSRWKGINRAASIRWQRQPGARVFATLLAGPSPARNTLLEVLGHDDEWHPDFVLVPRGRPETWDHDYLAKWCLRKDLWQDPNLLIPYRAEYIIAYFYGWIHVATMVDSAQRIINVIKELAHQWNVPLIEGPAEWAWFDYEKPTPT